MTQHNVNILYHLRVYIITIKLDRHDKFLQECIWGAKSQFFIKAQLGGFY